MDSTAVARATHAAMSVASATGLTVNDVAVLTNSNKLALRLLPCNVLARVAIAGDENFDSELEIAQKLAEQESPVARLHPFVEPRVYEHDAFIFTLWTHYEQVPGQVSPGVYAKALARLHSGMRKVSIDAPHFTDRIEEAQRLVATEGTLG